MRSTVLRATAIMATQNRVRISGTLSIRTTAQKQHNKFVNSSINNRGPIFYIRMNIKHPDAPSLRPSIDSVFGTIFGPTATLGIRNKSPNVGLRPGGVRLRVAPDLRAPESSAVTSTPRSGTISIDCIKFPINWSSRWPRSLRSFCVTDE